MLMTVPPSPSRHREAEMTCSDIDQELNFQLEESQQQLRDIEANFRITKATLYVLAAELRKFKSTKYKDVIDFVLGEGLQPKEQELAEKLSVAEQLRESCILIGEQRRKLSQLRQKSEEGSNESLLLKEHPKAVLTGHDADPTLGRDLRAQLAEGCRLAEVLAGKSESLEEESGKDCQSLPPRVSTGGVDKQGEHVPQDCQDDDQGQPSGPGEPSDRQQPACSAALPVDEISPSPDAAQPQDTLSQQEEEEEAVVTWYLEDGDDINDSLTYTLDKSYLMVSTCQDSPAPPKPSKTPVFLANQTPCEDEDAPEPEAPRKLTIEDQRRPPFLRTWCVTIQDNARKLTQHREQLRKGKEAAFSLEQCLRRLFTQEEPARAVQRHGEELVEAGKLADHLVLQLHIANCGSRTGEEEKEPLYQVDDQSSDFSFLIQAQARELTQLRKKLEAGRNVAFILQKNLQDLIRDNDSGESQGQSLLPLAEWCRLAEHLTLQLGSEHHCDTEDEEETESLDSSDEQQDEKVDDLLSEPEGILKPQEEQASALSRSAMELGNQMLTHIGNTCCSWKDIIFSLRHRIRGLLSRDGPGSREGHKLAEPRAPQPCPEPEPGSWRTAASPGILTGRRCGSGRRVRFLPASAEARPQGTCPQGLPSPTFEVPEDHCVGTQPGQYLDRGAGRATLSLSSAPWRFVGHTDAGQQWLHSTELNLDASLGLENSPKAEGDAVGGSGDTTHEIRAHGHPDATAVLRQRMMGRKPRFRQWKMACRFPGAQA